VRTEGTTAVKKDYQQAKERKHHPVGI